MEHPPYSSAAAITIRDYTPDDAASVFILHASMFPVNAGDMVGWTQRLEDKIALGGRVLLLMAEKRTVAYAALEPLPGLPGLWDLAGGTAVPWRGQGYGSRLLAAAKEQARLEGARNLSVLVDDLDAGPSRFLLRREFTLDHEECLLELDMLQPTPVAPEKPARVVTYERRVAIPRFCALYEASFASRPWAQPYTHAEVAGALRNDEDLLFLTVDDEPVAFVWIELLPGYRGRIEPMGVVVGRQGKGYGRHMLAAAVDRLRQRGAQTIEVGTWRDNVAALNLYKRAGFEQVARWYYLNHDLAG